jgi:nucleoside-diphosphate-sugar epimerase
MSPFTVLGGRGVVGQHLVRHLRSLGHQVHTPDRDTLFNPDHNLGHVVYAIGVTADFRHRPFDTVEAHVCMLRHILARARFDSLLYLSSTRVYGRLGLGTLATEDTPLAVDVNDPSDLYNLSKLMGESLCLHSGRPGVRVARLSNVVGGADQHSDNFIPSLVRAAKTGHITLRTAANSTKDYIHIDDVVHALERIAVEGQHLLYNVASGQPLSHQAWTDALSQATGCLVTTDPEAPHVGMPLIATNRLHALGVFPRNPLNQELINTWTP